MIPEAAQIWIEKLELIPHPEGGFYRETYRSDAIVGNRSVQTVIYFLITSNNISRFHRIKSDEIWFYHTGEALSVHTLTPEKGHEVHKVGLNSSEGEQPQLLVPANTIFGSTLEGENAFSLVSCTVAPGFDFADFELFKAEDLLGDYPQFEAVIRKMT